MSITYPVYVISKGRSESRLTVKALTECGVPYRIVIEPQEYDDYAKYIASELILTLPFSNLGFGSIPARNWVWNHSLSEGHKRHWILDDNIRKFFRYRDNHRIPVKCDRIFQAAEEFTDRYKNVGLSGFEYYMFIPNRSKVKPFRLNTRIYSCILVNNDLKFRWRGRYNEDTDLSLRVLKSGWCTILFQAFLAEKMTTMKMKGGNTDELYVDNGRLEMARSLQRQHPDVTCIKWKWGRWQHHVDYRSFRKNKLILRDGVERAAGNNEFGMELVVKERKGE